MSFVSASNSLHSEADCADNGSRMVRVIPQKCKQVLCHFMSFFHERPADGPCDPHAQQSTDDELLTITPDDTSRWLNLRTCGNPTADMQPTKEKCISRCQILTCLAWNDQSDTGNPTQSTQVNDMLTHVTLAEKESRVI